MGSTGSELDLRLRTRRVFTCISCGFPITYETGILQGVVYSTCSNCSEWTAKAADAEELVATAREIADELAGPILTDRQAFVYLLREILEQDRQSVAELLGSSPSNVDNLYRRGKEKFEEASRLNAALDALRTPVLG